MIMLCLPMLVNYLKNSDYGQIWLDIEVSKDLSTVHIKSGVFFQQGSQYWRSSYSENQQFFDEMLKTASVREDCIILQCMSMCKII